MEIRIDTSIMQQMASTSLRAKDSLEESIKAAKSIVSHNDWNCIERDSIDDGILQLQKSNDLMCEHMETFSKLLNTIADQINQFDREFESGFAAFDSLVGDLYSKKYQGAVVGSFPVSQSIPREIDTDSYWERYHSVNLFQPVSVVSFPDASIFLTGSTDSSK